MGYHPKKKSSEGPQLTTKEKLKQIKKERKLKLKEKRARLVVHNLPFTATNENVREHFQKFGDVESVEILKREDGKLVGCCFVQFKLVQKAAKARYHTNGQPFLGRNITVDFALAKNKFIEKSEIKSEPPENDTDVKVKEEPIDVDEIEHEVTEGKNEIKEEDDDDEESTKEEDSNSESDEEDEEEDIKEEEKKPKVISNDVQEGRTIFIKNVPFSVTNEDLKDCMRQFGPIYYALVCVDKFTEHSKGTAFVKFVNQEDAEKALSSGTELTLQGNILDCHKALNRNEIHQKATAKHEEKSTPKDSRNLYLVKEGVILAGSPAAQGVSATDMAKRLQLEQYKTQMLRNLNMFISKERLVVQNLPPTWDDKKFLTLMKNHSHKNAVIREARIMRDLKNVDANGVGASKEFGFVSFTRHEDALAALRSLNNNPKIFSAGRRPIVAFSIENKSMVKAKQNRLEKSRLKNPICKAYDPSVKKRDDEKKAERQQKQQQRVENEEGEKSLKNFVGVSAKPGIPKMRNRFKLKTQAKLHHENLKQEKKKRKFAKKTLKNKQEDFTKQPKQKINNKRKATDDNFSKLVNEYKQKLQSAPPTKKSKWYTE